MPKRTELFDQLIQVEKTAMLDESNPEEPVMVDRWFITFVDKQTREVLTIGFGQETRDTIVKKLMGGIDISSKLPP